MVKKNSGKKRLIGLDVDEFSLVDKPAIGETFYVTKSVNGKGEDKLKTKGKKEDKKKSSETETEVKASSTENTETENEETEETETEETETETTETTASVSSEDIAKIAETVKGLEARIQKQETSLQAVEKVLTDSLALHETAANALNEIVNLNLIALDAVMVLAADEEDSNAETTDGSVSQSMKLVQEIRDSIKAVRSEVSKAGAKISRGRMVALKEIAEKLAALIASVDSEDAEKGSKRKKSVEAAKALQTSFETLSGSVSKQFESLTESVKTLETGLGGKLESFAKRLEEVENTAGASDAIADEEETEDDSSSSGTSKSVFAGLIPVKEIQARVSKRQAFLKGDKEGK